MIRPAARPSPAWSRWDWAAMLGLALLIAALHGRSLNYGLFMDDYTHIRQLRSAGWSLADLTAACRLELIGDVLEVWYLPDCTLRFFRPIAFGLMKLTYLATGWSPLAMHIASLAWHGLVCALLMRLLRCLGANRSIAFAAAALYAIHPGNVATVQWIACQTELMVTAFLLAGTLCFGLWRNWPGFHTSRTDSTSTYRAAPHSGWLIAALSFYALALGCRENAIMLPVVLFLADRVCAKTIRADEKPVRRRRSLIACAGFVLVALIYVGLRAHYLGGAALPPRPYVIPPNAPDFVPFVLNKLCYYLLGEFFLVPSVPLAGVPYFLERPFLFYGLTLAAILAMLTIATRFRNEVAGHLAPAWLLLFMVPVLPAFASPHHLYLPGIGWAILMMLILRWVVEGAPLCSLTPRAAHIRTRLAVAGVVLCGAAFGLATFFFGMVLDAAQRVEDELVQEVIDTPTGLRDGDMLYFINLPMIGHYVRLAVEERTGLRGLRAHSLTWAPRILGVATPAELTPDGSGRLLAHIADDRYFAGPFAMLVREATGYDRPAQRTDSIARHGLGVEIAREDARGITAIRFSFPVLRTPAGRHVYFGSRVRWAQEIEIPE